MKCLCCINEIGEVKVNSRTYKFNFHPMFGPTLVRADGTFAKRQPSERHPFWDAFDAWLKAREVKL